MILTQDLELKLQVLLQQRQYGITAVQTVYWQQYRQHSLQDPEISAYVDKSLKNTHLFKFCMCTLALFGR